MRRSMLFLPANSPNMVVNGGVLGADSLIFDLEDAISPDEKDAARDLLRRAREALDFGRCECVSTGWTLPTGGRTWRRFSRWGPS